MARVAQACAGEVVIEVVDGVGAGDLGVEVSAAWSGGRARKPESLRPASSTEPGEETRLPMRWCG